nr:unnamed protein product [Digitaria exilis]
MHEGWGVDGASSAYRARFRRSSSDLRADERIRCCNRKGKKGRKARVCHQAIWWCLAPDCSLQSGVSCCCGRLASAPLRPPLSSPLPDGLGRTAHTDGTGAKQDDKNLSRCPVDDADADAAIGVGAQ